MTFLVLNRRPIVERIPEWLADLGDELVLITAASVTSDDTAARVVDSYREIVVVEDYDSPDVDRLVVATARRHACRRILGTTEVDVLRAARARAELDLPGQDMASAFAYRNKITMKRSLANAGIPVRTPVRLRGVAGLRNFAREHGFPVVVKPFDGGGSVGVAVLDEPATLERWAQEASDEDWRTFVVEAWLGGTGYHVDGLMAAGEVVQCWPSQMRHPNLATVRESRPFTSWMLPVGDPLGKRLRTHVQAVVGSLPGPAEVTAFHAEVFHTPEDQLVLGEIGCRPGGCGVVPTYEHAFGMNLHAANLRGQAGIAASEFDLDVTPRRTAGFVWFPPQPATLRSLPTRCPIDGVYRYHPTGMVGHRYQGAHSIANHVAQVFVAGTGSTDLEPVMTRVENWWTETASWTRD